MKQRMENLRQKDFALVHENAKAPVRRRLPRRAVSLRPHAGKVRDTEERCLLSDGVNRRREPPGTLHSQAETCQNTH
jgi:hypothetical protein